MLNRSEVLSVITTLALATCVACNGSNGSTHLKLNPKPIPTLNRSTQNLKMTYDRQVNDAQKSQVEAALSWIESKTLEVKDGSYFAKIFGGTAPNGITNYLTERMHFFIDTDTDLLSRFTVDGAPYHSTQSGVITVATNVGTPLWFAAMGLPSGHQYGFNINDENIALDSSRVGIIQLGTGYARVSDIKRASTLIHEARHSDCPVGYSSDVSERIKSHDGYACGQSHALCPEGHAMAGSRSCDKIPWGAYAVEGVYLAAISEKCTNCTDDEKQVAKSIELDVLSRVLILEDLVNGKFGDPDMTNRK